MNEEIIKALLIKPVDEMTIEEKKALVKAANDIEDYTAVGEQIAAMLMDEDVSTYDMMEDIANAYLYADVYPDFDAESFRKGMDKAFTILLWHSVAGAAQKILQNLSEEEGK